MVEVQQKRVVEDIKAGYYTNHPWQPDPSKIPVNPEVNILAFIADVSPSLEEWERELINIVVEEAHYFMPQIRTKIMNEGWASFWHYKLLHELEIPQKFHIPFLKMHNAVVRPHIGGVNPYHLGFYIFQKIEKENGLDECFFIREVHDDE